MTLLMVRRFADRMSESLTPCRAAMPERVSPALMVYEAELAGAGAGAAGAGAGAGAGADGAEAAPILICWPGWITERMLRPFQLKTSESWTPCRAAMALRVSP